MENSSNTTNNAPAHQSDVRSLVDFILEEKKKQQLENENHIMDQLPVMNASKFFAVENGRSIGDKNVFLRFIMGLKDNDLRNLESFLEMMNKKVKFNISPFPKKDANGNEYYWIKVVMPNGNKEFKLVLFKGLDELLQSYLYNIYRYELTLTELYHEAQKA